MKKISYVCLLILFLAVVFGCKKVNVAPSKSSNDAFVNDSLNNSDSVKLRYGIKVIKGAEYANKSGLLAIYTDKEAKSQVFFYGLFDNSGAPATIQKSIVQKVNSDTLIISTYDSLLRVTTTRCVVNGVSNDIVFALNYDTINKPKVYVYTQENDFSSFKLNSVLSANTNSSSVLYDYGYSLNKPKSLNFIPSLLKSLNNTIGPVGTVALVSAAVIGGSALCVALAGFSTTQVVFAGMVAYFTMIGNQAEAAPIKETNSITENYPPNPFTNYPTEVINASISNSVKAGQYYGGGIVVYILLPGDEGYDSSKKHGLIMSTSDQSLGQPWTSNQIYVNYTILSDKIGAGYANTMAIINNGGGNGAAKLCADLILEGFDDWYLPNSWEMYKAYSNGYGDLAKDVYWTSSLGAISSSISWGGTINCSAEFWTCISYDDQNKIHRVRAFRTF